MPFDFGDIVLVPFPFTSQTASKKRPAVVVSGGTYNQTRPDVVVMAVTSQFVPIRTGTRPGSANGKPPDCSSLRRLSRSSQPSNKVWSSADWAASAPPIKAPCGQ